MRSDPANRESTRPPREWIASLWVVGIYAGLSVAWILVTHRFVGVEAHSALNAAEFGVLEDVLVVAITSVVLYFGVGFTYTKLGDQTLRSQESQRTAEESLHALAWNEEQLRLALGASRQGLWDLDLNKRQVIATTPQYALMLGYDPEDFRESWDAWAARLHPADRERALRIANDYIANPDGLYESEFRMRRADGGWIWVRSFGSVVERDAAGKPSRMLGTHVDISEHKEQEDALEQGKQTLALALELLGQRIWELDVASGELTTTPQYAEWLGYRPDGFHETISTWSNRLHPDEKEHVLSVLAETAAGGEGSHPIEFRLRRADGSWMWLQSVSSVSEFNQDGSAGHVVGVHIDVTQPRRAKEEKRRVENQFREVFEHSSIAKVISDPDGRFTRWNRAFREMTGYSDEELRGMTFADLGFAEATTQAGAHAPDGAASGEARIERTFLRKDGSIRWTSGTISEVLDSSGEPDYQIGMLDDITDRKALEDELSLHKFAADHAASPVVWADTEGTIVYANEVAADMVGRTPQTFVGAKVWDFSIDTSPDSWDELVDEVRRKGVERCIRIQDPDSGRMSIVEERVDILRSGDREYVASAARDITNQVLEGHRREVNTAVNEALAAAKSAPEAWASAIEKVCEGFEFPLGEVWLRDLTGDLRLTAKYSLPGWDPSRLNAANASYRYGPTSALGVFADPGERAKVAEVTEVADANRAWQLTRSGFRRAVIAPVRHASQLLAVLLLFTNDTAEIPVETLWTLEDIASRIGQAVERERLEESLHHRALYDDLTGLPNAALFSDRLERDLAVGDSPSQSDLMVLLCEVDQFDMVNDSYGIDESERLLRETARRIGAVLGARDTAARLARDEFAILAHGIGNPEDAASFLDRLDRSFDAPITVAGTPMTITVSTGCAFSFGQGNMSALLRDATTALHRARRTGRGTRAFFDEHMHETVERALWVEMELRTALDSGQIEVYYQPLIDAKGGSVLGAEALARWRHPERGLLLPADFMEIAEDTGLINELGQIVLDRACEDCVGWNAEGYRASVSVNLSAVQFLNADLASLVLAALKRSSLPRELLTLEITETALMQNPEQTDKILRQLRDLDVRTAVDDFGTGYSSLSYLTQFALDALKVDRSFIAGLPENPDDVAVAFAVAEMAHTLGLQVIAEGVETREQLDFVRSADYDSLQGFLVGAPMPLDEFLVRLRQPALRA